PHSIRAVRRSFDRSGHLGSALMVRLSAPVAALLLATLAARADTLSDCTQDSDVEQKLRACTKLIEESARDPEKRAHGHLNRGNAYQFKRDFDSAILEFDQAIRLYPNSPTVYYNRGNAHQARNDFDRSISDYDQV